MIQTMDVSKSQAIRDELRALDERGAELATRQDQLNEEIDRLQTDLGRAMAVGDAAAVDAAKKALRNAEDEREGAERGLAYLTSEEERLEAERHAALIEEAAATRDAKVAEAVDAIEELAESLADYLKTLVPLAERAASLTTAANKAERLAAQRAGERVPSTGRARSEGWARYPGLETVTAALQRYGRVDGRAYFD